MAKRIGDFLLEKGILSEAQLQEALKYSQRTGLRLGDAALALKMLTREKLVSVFGPNFAVSFFNLEPEHFPEGTKDLLPVEAILRLGALPLGIKTEYRLLLGSRKVLNLGLLDPERRDAAETVLGIAKAKLGEQAVSSVNVFLILPDQFLRILSDVFKTNEENIRQTKQDALDGTLVLYFENVPGSA